MSGVVDITKDLKPCPFCGSKNLRVVPIGKVSGIECNRCRAVGPYPEHQASDGFVYTWDTRPIEAALEAEIIDQVC